MSGRSRGHVRNDWEAEYFEDRGSDQRRRRRQRRERPKKRSPGDELPRRSRFVDEDDWQEDLLDEDRDDDFDSGEEPWLENDR